MADTSDKRYLDYNGLKIYDSKIKEWAKELDEPIDASFVTNNSVGALLSGTSIKETDTLASLIMKMLVSVKDATLNSNPTMNALTNAGGTAAGSYEVGTTISTNLGTSFNDGAFNSYKAGSNTQTEVIGAGCVPTGPTYTLKNGSDATVGYDNPQGSFVLKAGTATITGSYSYAASTAKAKKSDGSESTISIKPGSVSRELTWTGYYKFYEGAVDAIPAVINRANVQGLNQGAYKTSFNTKMNKKYYMICIPENKTIHVKDTATNADLTGTMKKKEVTIEDAAGRAKTYYMWTCEYASSVGLENNVISITFS